MKKTIAVGAVLLGLFAFGLCLPSRVRPRERAIPIICICAPVSCYLLSVLSEKMWNYHFGYELLLLNGALTMLGMALSALFFVKKHAV